MRSAVNKKAASEKAAAKRRADVLGWLPWLVPMGILTITLAAFFPVLQSDFVRWDDHKAIVENPNFRGLGWAELRWMFTTFHMSHYQPLSWVTFGLDYLLWGMDPFGYHLTNLLLHAANAVAFYFLALRLLAHALSPSMVSQDSVAVRLGAGLAALLFSIHPLRVESVAWITERRDVLSGFFLLGALLCYLQAVSKVQSRRRRLAWMGGALGVYGLSLFAKAAGMTLPVVLMVLDIYPLKRLGGGPGRWFGREARSVWLEKVPFLALGLAVALVAAAAQSHSGAMLSLEQHGVIDRVAQAFFGLVFYLWKTVVPLGLSPLYEKPLTIHLWDWPFLLSEVVVVVVSAGLILMRRLWPAGLAIWICYVAVLAPTLGVAQSGPQLVADRYSYLSCLGWAILAGGALYRCWAAWGNHRLEPWILAGFMGLAAVGITGLGILTWRQTQVWRDTESLWRHTVAVTPKASIAHYNLALHLERQGKQNEAVGHYRQAVAINPFYLEAHTNLGNALSSRGELDNALVHYREALRLDPASVDAHNNVGIVLAKKGELEKAIEHYHDALKIDPESGISRYHLGNALARQGKLDEAVEEYRWTLKTNPNDAKAHNNLGSILAGRGDLDEALAHFREVLKINPQDAEPYYNVANVLAMQGKLDEAIDQYRQLLKIAPNDFIAYSNLAIVFIQRGDLDSAMNHLRKALEINPAILEVRYTLANVLATQGKLDEAIEEYRQILSRAPEFAQAHENLARLLLRQGKRAEAIKHMEEALRLLKTASRSKPVK